MYNRVEDFMAKLAQQTAPMSRTESKNKSRTIEKISLNFQGNYGRYQVLPMDNVVTGHPFVTLFDTKEVCMPRKSVDGEGKEIISNSWIRILPKSAYIMKDMTGRVVSSLTAEDEELLNRAYSIFNELYTELDVRNNQEYTRELIRSRNYTVFHAMCLNMWKLDGDRTPDRSNFCGLFVTTAKGFVQAVEDNIKDRAVITNGDISWIEGIYNRNLTGRDGFVMFNISRAKTGAGYTVTVAHESGRADMLKNVSIPEADAQLMEDPVASFLGWQASNRDKDLDASQRRLFNASLIKEAISYLTSQLAAVRMAKSAGTDVKEAIKGTMNNLINNAPAISGNVDSVNNSQNAAVQVDGITGAQQQQTYSAPQQNVVHNDPLQGAQQFNNTGAMPTQGGNSSAPTFTGGFSGAADLPF